jgi:hypothetical protein
MVRIHNPIPSNQAKKPGSDGQLHGGMMESIDQLSILGANSSASKGNKKQS